MNTITKSQSANMTASRSQSEQLSPTSQLGKEAFLKILVTQLKAQDPLEPMKDQQFIAQMAQFSSLEQLSNLNKTMTNFVHGGEQGKSLVDQSSLIGKKVTVAESEEGIVKAILIKNGQLFAELENETTVPMTSITKIEDVK
jgi:flagellar basal-body rod modification protein FlgD